MARSRTIVIAGAGIGGLTAALALTRAGFRAVVLEQAARLEETGAGIQLSPNATRVLFDLGLGERLRPLAVAPEAIRVVNGASGRDIVRVPLGLTAAQRYGAPYWVIHRADLQAVLAITIAESPDVTLRLGTGVENFAVHQHGITVRCAARRGCATNSASR
jgi:salicylate hydroxylase